MSKKMTKLKKIMDLLANKEMTSVELAPMLKISVPNCSYKLNILMNDKRIKRTNNTRPFKYKLAMSLEELLKQLYDLMEKKMDFVVSAIDDDLELLKTIKEVID